MLTINSILFYTNIASDNISDLASCLYAHPDVATASPENGNFSWYKGPDKTSEELAEYLAKETNREKIAVLLDFLGRGLFSINYEQAYAAAFRAKNINAVAELNRAGCDLPGNDFYDIFMSNPTVFRPYVFIHYNKDRNLTSKHVDPRIILNRHKHRIAIGQAYFLLKTDYSKIQNIGDLFMKAIEENNERAFFYLLHSNFEHKYDVKEIAFKLIDLNKLSMIEEMVRQGYKFDMGKPVTAIEYAVGKIKDEDFTCFFPRIGAGRLDAEIDNDLLKRISRKMKNDEVIKKQYGFKPAKPSEMGSDRDASMNTYPKVEYKITKFQQTTFSPIIRDNFDTSQDKLFRVCANFGTGEVYYHFGRNEWKASYLLEDMFPDESTVRDDDDPIILELDIDTENEKAFEIVMAFIKGISKKEDYICDTGAPVWIEQLIGTADIESLWRIHTVAKYLDVQKFYSAIGFYMRKIMSGLPDDKLRYCFSLVGDLDFNEIDFSHVVKGGGIGPNDI